MFLSLVLLHRFSRVFDVLLVSVDRLLGSVDLVVLLLDLGGFLGGGVCRNSLDLRCQCLHTL